MSHRTDLTFGSLNLSLGAIEIDTLLPHEETIQELTDSLAAEIIKDGAQIDPVVVDAQSRVILDGTHRVAALTSLGCKSIIVCSVDYSNPSIKVHRWMRCISALPVSLLDDLSRVLLLHTTDISSATSAVDSGGAPVALITRERAYLSRREFVSLGDAYSLVRQFDRILTENGIRFTTLPDQLALKTIGAPYQAVLYAPPVKKSDVLNSALNRKFFPAKSTKHYIPVRPVAVTYPLDRLIHMTGGDADSHLKQILESSIPVMLAPGTAYRGRTYEENLLNIRGN